jgi:hypothetical protein
MRKKLFVCTLFLFIFFTACGTKEIEEIDFYLHPPKLTPELEGLNNIAKNYIDKDYEIFMPKNILDKELIFFKDLNSDNIQEAIMFLKDANGKIFILISSYLNSVWKEESLIDLSSFSLAKFIVEDLDKDGLYELYALVEDENSYEKKIFVFEKDIDGVCARFSKIVSDMVVGSISNQKKQLFLVTDTRDNGDNSFAFVEVFDYENDRFGKKTDVQIEPYFYGPYMSQIGKLNKKSTALILNMGVGEHSGLTEIILEENGKLINVFNSNKINQLSLLQNHPVVSEDINNDGYIEISIPEPTKGSEGKSFSEIVWIDKWYQVLEDNSLEYKIQSIDNYSVMKKFIFPKRWDGKIGAEINKWNESEPFMDFYIIDNGSKIPLLWIYFIDRELYEIDELEGLNLIEETEKYYIMYQLFEVESKYEYLQLSNEEIKNNFKNMRE